jgi:hypothetical protein
VNHLHAPAVPSWTDAFRNPPREDRPQPFWSWNADIDEARIDAMVETFAAQGCGGVFVHPRPGLVTDYLSPRWFALWRYAAERCAARGMACHIYDENSFPSGFSGGHVVSSVPSTAARMVRGEVLTAPRQPDGRLLGCADPHSGALLPGDAWRQASPAQPVLVMYEVHDKPDPWHAGFASPDISLPATGRAFIATTHEAYARECGPYLGSTAQLVFTDEPTLVRTAEAQPWSEELELAFAAGHGYRLADRLGLLFIDGPGHEAVRHDYHATLNRMLCGNFFKPIHDWCAAHRLGATGHVDEHLWPEPSFLPSAAAVLRWMQVPGNDLLGFQFAPDRREDARVLMARLNLRELDAVRRQCGRERCVVESCGGGGYAYGPKDMKPLEDWAVALGTSLINPHLAHVSLQGSRKYDWPQTVSDHSAWAADLGVHHLHVARVITALRRGTVERRVGVLMPTATAWLHARPGLAKDGPLARLREQMLALVEQLECAGIDWDPIDECVLAEIGRVDGSVLHVGACAYQAVVVPAAMAGWESSTLTLLAGAAVPLHGEGAARPRFVDGRPDPRPAGIARWQAHADATALAAALRAAFPPQLAQADGASLPPELAWRRVETPDGSLFFLCNPWNRPLRSSLRLPGRGVLALDTADGSISTVASAPSGDGQRLDLELAPGDHALWLCTAAAAGAAPTAPAWRTLPVSAAGIAADHANVLVLDHAELRIAGQAPLAGTAVRLDSALWTAMGFRLSGWSRAIQFRRTLLDHPVGHLPSFSVAYAFDVDAGVDLRSLRLAVELPELYRITVNGAPVSGWQPWFDPAMGAAPIGTLVRSGRNTVELIADRFCTRHELANLHLLGDFALRPAEHGFAIAPPRPLTLGSWRSLGRPLANGAMTYAWDAVVDAPAARLRVRLPAWAGATWRLSLDGAIVARAGHGEDELIADVAVSAGTHHLGITVVSHLAGLLGPHHGEGLPGRWTWERAWEPLRAEAPPGDGWRAPETGLLAPPEIAVSS